MNSWKLVLGEIDDVAHSLKSDDRPEWLLVDHGSEFHGNVRHVCGCIDHHDDEISGCYKCIAFLAVLSAGGTAEETYYYNWKCNYCDVEVPEGLRTLAMMIIERRDYSLRNL